MATATMVGGGGLWWWEGVWLPTKIPPLLGLTLGTIEMTIDHTIDNEIESTRIAALPEQPQRAEDGYIAVPYGEYVHTHLMKPNPTTAI